MGFQDETIFATFPALPGSTSDCTLQENDETFIKFCLTLAGLLQT